MKSSSIPVPALRTTPTNDPIYQGRVPEPGTVPLVGLALMAAVAALRRRSSRQAQ